MSRTRITIFILILTFGVLVAAALTACGGQTASHTSTPGASPASPTADPIAMLVDGRPVHRSAVEAVRAEFRLGGNPDTEARAEQEAVRRELLRHEAEQLGVTADAAEVESRRGAMVQQAGGEEALAELLAGVPISEEQLRRGLEDGVLHEAVQDAKFPKLKTSVAEARKYYEAHRSDFREEGSVHLYAIRVAAEPIALNALKRLQEGRPFAEVARQFTTDAEAKANGGDLGVVALSSLPKSFVQALDKGEPGEVVGPVQGPGGWFLLRATDMQHAHVSPFATVRAAIVKELTRRDRYRALEKWLDAARKQATVTRP